MECTLNIFFSEINSTNSKATNFLCKIQEVIGNIAQFISEVLLFALWWCLGTLEPSFNTPKKSL